MSETNFNFTICFPCQERVVLVFVSPRGFLIIIVRQMFGFLPHITLAGHLSKQALTIYQPEANMTICRRWNANKTPNLVATNYTAVKQVGNGSNCHPHVNTATCTSQTATTPERHQT